MLRPRIAAALCVAAVGGMSATGSAQNVDGLRAGVGRTPVSGVDSSPPPADERAAALPGASDIRLRRLAPLSSAILPGSGQLALGNDRFIVYLAAEAIGWWRLAKSSHEESQQVAAFKTIARTVARSHFSTAPPDGDWTYYETMRDFLESGAYSMTNAGPVVPESDPTTYNGHLWLQERATHSTTAAALAQYEIDAIKPNFQWSWRNAQLQYDQFKRTTALRNDAHYATVQGLLLIAANHVLSMVDAFATFRIQVRPAPGGGGSLGASAKW